MIKQRLTKFLSGPLVVGRRPMGPARAVLNGPDWVQADPDRIQRTLALALAKPGGGWFVVNGSRQIGREPKPYTIAGRDLILWRDATGVKAADERCPHMGASLAGAKRRGDCLVCPWHGLRLGPKGHGAWAHVRAHDDGVLTWVCLPSNNEPQYLRPILPPRPPIYIDGVIRVEARCDPEDVLANRLDPWHGVHYHPYAFRRLVVTDISDAVLTLRVAYKLVGPLAVEIDCTFHCPDPRTIVMTITGGDGVGSVVETHATPLTRGRTAIVEATIATSDRPGFRHALRTATWVRRFIERSARQLWVDDAAYAEQRYRLRALNEETSASPRTDASYEHLKP